MKQTVVDRKRVVDGRHERAAINIQSACRHPLLLETVMASAPPVIPPFADAPAVTRRLLLRRFTTGTSIFGTFLLPGNLYAAMTDPLGQQLEAGPARQRATADPSRQRSIVDPSRHHAKAASSVIGSAHPAQHAGPEPGITKRPMPLVMLDPGHGGKDPGAIGISGIYEKHVALATALELRHLLQSSGRYRVELTRINDTFIPLDDRVYRAQRQRASLFVSMHADALSDHAVRGASVYTLAPTASDAQTAALAQRENSADRFIGRQWQGTSPEVSHILASLVRQETRSGSVRIARSLVGSLDQDLPMLQNPDRHASFVVLKAADIPSVLVEMGFMSNVRDEAALRQPAHRKLVAQAMHRAVDAYFIGTERMASQAFPTAG